MTIFPRKESFRCLPLALWDEDGRRLVGFRDARSSAGGYAICLAISLVVARRKYEEE